MELRALEFDGRDDKLLRQLRRDGYIIINNAAGAETIKAIKQELEAHFTSADLGRCAVLASETESVEAATARSEAAVELIRQPTVLKVVNEMLGEHCESVQLNRIQASEVGPGSAAQAAGREEDMWRREKECGTEYAVNAMWALDDCTPLNGPLHIWPASNRRPSEKPLPDEAAVPIVMPAGSVCLFLGSTLHAVGENLTSGRRRSLLVSYCQGGLNPMGSQWLTYPPVRLWWSTRREAEPVVTDQAL